MKSAKTIIEHFYYKPQNSKMLEMACYEKVKSMLPSHLANAVKFIYQKNHTLFFVLNHPGMKMEFHYKHTLIKTLLKKLKDFDENCKDIQITKIDSFVSHTAMPTLQEAPKVKRYYVEKSTGTFQNRAKNETLKAIFDDIQTTILDTLWA